MPTPAPDDWRRQGQEVDLAGRCFEWRGYRAPSPEWDHDHCEFCWAKFMVGVNAPPDALPDGYRTVDGDDWVCRQCFEDFRDEFGFTVISSE